MALTITVVREEFLTGLASLQSIIGKKGTMAILSNVLIKAEDNAIEMFGTDLEVGIKTTVAAEVVSPGAVTLPAKKLFEAIRESEAKTIHLAEVENHWVKIGAGSSVYNLAGTASEEYPDFPEYKEEKLVSLPSQTIRNLIDRTIFSVAQDRESNYTLTGVLFEKESKENNAVLRMISSDGHRLTIMEEEVEGNIDKLGVEKNTIIPRKGIVEIRKICEGKEKIFIGVDVKQVVVKADKTILIIRLMTGEFPDYRSIISVIDRDKVMETDRKVFLNSLKRTNLFTEDTFNAVQFEIFNNRMVLTSQNMDYGNARDELSIKYEGEEITIGFNCRYFMDSLQTMISDQVNIHISSDQSPCLITGEDDQGFYSIIMPMKI